MSISFKQYCIKLGCPLRNPAWSWSAMAADKSRSIFTVWADQVVDGRYFFMSREQSESWAKRRGANELVENFRISIKERSEVLGVLCFAEDTEADPRKRKGFDEENLLLLELVEEPQGYFAYIKGQVRTSDAVTGRVRQVATPPQYAVDDLEAKPEGVLNPERASATTSGYLRDNAIREYVLKRAKGVCEYCGKEGFITRAGNRYIETHHIVALSANGPDTISNVIGLCPEHHKEAHYGANAVHLESIFIDILGKLEMRQQRA